MEQENENIVVASSIKEAFAAGLKSAKAQVINGGLVLHHKQFQVSDTRENLIAEDKRLKPSPENPNATIQVNSSESFPLVFADYSNPQTKTFANAEKRTIISVFDFIKPDNANPGYGDLAMGWGQFRASMALTLSRKLKQWRSLTIWQSQAEFASFIEDHLEDVLESNYQDLLALATDLEDNRDIHFKGKLNLDGSVQLTYRDEFQTTVNVPENLVLWIPLFEHGDKYKVKCRLRVKVTSGDVCFRIQFTNLEDALDDEFERIVQELEEQTGASIIRGDLSLGY